jgi:type VI secretion system secreted protein VgrG
MPGHADSTSTTLALSAAAPLDGLFVQALSGSEGMDMLFHFELSCRSNDDALDLKAALGKHLTVTLGAAAAVRPLDGMCARIRQRPAEAGFAVYLVELRPWLWWLTLSSDNRIFQNKSVPDIVEAVFDGGGYTDYELQLSASYTARDYCVQYGETDFAFVSRLLEEEGIHYFFRHEAGSHTLVLADSSDAYAACPGAASVAYAPAGLGARELQAIRSGEVVQEAASAAFTGTDFAFATPATSLLATAEADAAQPAMVEYPGGWSTKSAGDALAKIRADALGSGARTLRGESDHRGLAPGHSFTLAGHARSDANADWVLREVSHEADHTRYGNRFVAFPKDATTRPARLTPRARIHGSQTAIVVGKSGEEIWTDEYGRVKVQFHWDRVGKSDENSSCWVRVAQAWAGKGFGAQFIPRVGQEVVVSFLDGDPDRPLVTGSVYNGANALPYTVPASQTQSGVKTESSKGGAGFNEIRFEDKKDAEELYLHAQKDMKTEVLNDASLQVKQNQTIEVQEGNRTVTVAKGNLSTAVDTGNETLTVKGTRGVTVDGAETHTNKADFTHDAGANYTLTIKGNLSIDVTGSVTIKAGTSFDAEAGTALTNKAGTSLTNQAGTELTNKAGTSLTNDAGLSLTNKASASQTVDGGGMLTLKGGLVKIN